MSDTAPNGGPNCPPDINDRARKLWRSVVKDFPEMMDHQLNLLRRLVQTITIVDKANEVLIKDGTTYFRETKDGGYWTKRPEVDIVKDGVTAERLLTKELYLDPLEDDEPV